IPDTILAILKLVLLILFTLNSAQFCAIFVFKNTANRKMLAEFLWRLAGIVTKYKVAPTQNSTPQRSARQPSVSQSI
ncbi:hypothetical protein PMAYCL1PPCAC_14989, partial [Pristionchus mayeri]